LVVRVTWDGAVHQPTRRPWRVAGGRSNPKILLSVDPQQLHPTIVPPLSERPGSYTRYFPPRGGVSEGAGGGMQPGPSMSTVALVHGNRGAVHLVDTGPWDGLTVSSFGAQSNTLLDSFVYGPKQAGTHLEALVSPLPFFVRGEIAYIGMGKALFFHLPF